MSCRSLTLIAAVLALTLAPQVARAEVKVPAVFSDHMVLQRDLELPVWGTASPGEEITATIDGQEQSTTAGDDGQWQIKLKPLKVGGPHVLSIQGSNAIEIKDVLVGEVWIGSGQSNMAGGVGGYAKNDEVLAKMGESTYPNLRLCRGRGGSWQEATPETIKGFSALLFSFGQPLQQELDVPVGLILGAVGGTPSGRWLTDEMLARDAATRDFKAANGGDLYKQHILPVVPYGIRGVLWDQGESGTAIKGLDQFTTMGALIGGWRDVWGQGEFPFLYVQKPSGGGCAWDPDDPVTQKADKFAALPAAPGPANGGAYRELHIRIMQHPNTAMVTARDLGSGVHPTNKSGYGRRAARVALGKVYERDVEIYGPMYESHKVDGDKIRVTFSHVGQGLAWKHGDRLQGFEIAGEDGVFHWADAEIDGDAVIVFSDGVAKPKAVRYAWSQKSPWANLFNKDGLPALTFRAGGN